MGVYRGSGVLAWFSQVLEVSGLRVGGKKVTLTIIFLVIQFV